MKVRYYDATFPDPNITSELEAMFNSGSEADMEAASRFITALAEMQLDRQVYAKPAAAAVRAHFGQEQSVVFGGNVQCMHRHAEGHRLYLTFLPRMAALTIAELRALTIHPEDKRTFGALDAAVQRHSSLNP